MPLRAVDAAHGSCRIPGRTRRACSAAADAAFAAAADAAALEAARIEFLGAKSGRLKAVQKGLGTVAKADKPAAGKRFNEVKQRDRGRLRRGRRSGSADGAGTAAGRAVRSHAARRAARGWAICTRSRRRSRS